MSRLLGRKSAPPVPSKHCSTTMPNSHKPKAAQTTSKTGSYISVKTSATTKNSTLSNCPSSVPPTIQSFSQTDACCCSSELAALRQQVAELFGLCKDLETKYSELSASVSCPTLTADKHRQSLTPTPSSSPLYSQIVATPITDRFDSTVPLFSPPQQNSPKSPSKSPAPTFTKCVPNPNQTNYVFFSGPQNPLSNLFPAPIIVDGMRFCSNEQYIQWSKARLYCDSLSEVKILSTTDSHAIRNIGKSVAGYRESKSLWFKKAQGIVYSANLYKYKQNAALLACLLATGNSFLAESTMDPTWGIGVRHNEARKSRPSDWTGSNLAGRVLMDVRTFLTTLYGSTGNRKKAVRTKDSTVLIGDSHVQPVANRMGDASNIKCISLGSANVPQVTAFAESRSGELPRHIAVHAGSTDLMQGASPSQVAQKFALLLQYIFNKSPDTKVSVFGIPLTALHYKNVYVKRANLSISAVCRLFSADFIPTEDIFHQSGKLSTRSHSLDGHRLSKVGYDSLTRIIKGKLAPNV